MSAEQSESKVWWLAIDTKEDHCSYEQLKERKVVAQGWPALGDLSRLTGLASNGLEDQFKDELRGLYDEASPGDQRRDNVLDVFWRLFHLQPNDLVVGIEGYTVRGICQVSKYGYESYRFQPDYHFAHSFGFPVDWHDWDDASATAPPVRVSGRTLGIRRIRKEADYVRTHWELMSDHVADWPEEELDAVVVAYVEMRKKDMARQPFVEKSYYADLVARFGRTEKSYEYRMRNISHIYSLMGRDWISGLRPAEDVGPKLAGRIERLINRVEGQISFPVAEDMAHIHDQKEPTLPPEDNRKPSRTNIEVTQIQRSHAIVAWVLHQAAGICECCEESAPFSKRNGTPFLEVHHLRRLADDGKDWITNAIAVCPNCHRELHHGANRASLVESVYSRIERLIAE
jgi:5-methylcytosine-specific restriction protein A